MAFGDAGLRHQFPIKREQLGDIGPDRVPRVIRRALECRGQDRAQEKGEDDDSHTRRRQAGRPEDRPEDPPHPAVGVKPRLFRETHW